MADTPQNFNYIQFKPKFDVPQPKSHRESKETSPVAEINRSKLLSKESDYQNLKSGYPKTLKKVSSHKNTIDKTYPQLSNF